MLAAEFDVGHGAPGQPGEPGEPVLGPTLATPGFLDALPEEPVEVQRLGIVHRRSTHSLRFYWPMCVSANSLYSTT